MARDYGKVSPRFWTGETGRQLRAVGPEAQVVALYLLTAPSANMVGLYYLPVPTLSHETGIPLEGASKALRRLSEVGFAHYDDTDEVVWVPEMARHQVADELDAKDKRVQGIIRESSAYKKCRFYADFLARYREPFHLQKAPAPEGLRSPSEAPSKPLRSQEQEQEQEQEHAAARAQARAEAPTLRAVPAPEAEAEAKRVDAAGSAAAGKLGAAWVCRLERELGRGLAAGTPETRAELEQLLSRPGHGGPDRALAWVVTTLDERRRAGGPVPGSVAYVTRLLASLPPVEVGAMDRTRESCPEWGRLLDAAMALPAGNAPTQYQLHDVLLPLRATFLRGELHLEASNEGRRLFVEEVYLEGLRRLATETLGPHVLVHLTAAAPATAREA